MSLSGSQSDNKSDRTKNKTKETKKETKETKNKMKKKKKAAETSGSASEADEEDAQEMAIDDEDDELEVSHRVLASIVEGSPWILRVTDLVLSRAQPPKQSTTNPKAKRAPKVSRRPA